MNDWQENKTSLAEGWYEYKVYANDSATNLNVSETRNLTIDITLPTLTWVTPADDNSSIFGGSFDQDITAADAYLYMFNCTIYDSSDNPVWSAQYNKSDAVSYTKTDTVDVSSWSDGTYYEICEVSDEDYDME